MIIKIKNNIEYLWVKVISYFVKLEMHNASGRFYMYPSVRVDNPKNIILEIGVTLYRRGWIYSIPEKSEKSIIRIKKGTKIYDNFHITSSLKGEIGQNCLINRNVLITDTVHNYENIEIPIIKQGDRASETIIGDDCWIGNNVAIVSSIIGKHCVIGANTVIVNKTIPDYSLVGGNPGRILKQYSFEEKKWITVK